MYIEVEQRLFEETTPDRRRETRKVICFACLFFLIKTQDKNQEQYVGMEGRRQSPILKNSVPDLL
jgi:hypothetical protein